MHIPPQFDPYTQETTKVAELKDQFGKTRFKIALTDYDDNEYPHNDDLRAFDTYFQVTVISYCYGDALDTPVTLVEEVFTNIKAAYDRFYELVAQYRHLINVETRGWQDISVYKDKINYHKIDPDCCRNCIWAKPVTPKVCPPEELRKHKGRFVCMNPDLQKDVSDFERDDPHHHDNFYHRGEHRQHFKFDLAPYTQEDGLCDFYRRAVPDIHKTQAERDQHLVDRHGCDRTIGSDRPHPSCDRRNIDEQIIKYEVNRHFKSAISTDILPEILPEIGHEIEKQLSANPPIIEGNRMINDYNNNGQIDPDEIAYDGGGAF